MGADIKSLRTRIKSVDSTLHLTKAMGLVASSKIRRASEAMMRSREYSDAYATAVGQLKGCKECEKSPYALPREGNRTLLVAVAGDRGLAGGYNANIFRLLREYPEAQVIPVGKRACDRFAGETLLAETFSFREAKPIADRICRAFVAGEVDRVGILCTKYHSLMSQEATVKWILPISVPASEQTVSAVFEPDEITVLNAVIPDYVAGILVSCVKESFASEVAARRVAMDSAGKNAQEMIDRLGLEYNRARQGAITQEITEIVAGSGV